MSLTWKFLIVREVLPGIALLLEVVCIVNSSLLVIGLPLKYHWTSGGGVPLNEHHN